MIYPSIGELTKDGKINRYELVIATAKCARKITDEYVAQRELDQLHGLVVQPGLENHNFFLELCQ